MRYTDHVTSQIGTFPPANGPEIIKTFIGTLLSLHHILLPLQRIINRMPFRIHPMFSIGNRVTLQMSPIAHKTSLDIKMYGSSMLRTKPPAGAVVARFFSRCKTGICKQFHSIHWLIIKRPISISPPPTSRLEFCPDRVATLGGRWSSSLETPIGNLIGSYSSNINTPPKTHAVSSDSPT